MGFKKSTSKILHNLNEELKPKMILDVGCGSRIYEHIFSKSNYLGIDVEISGRTSEQKLVDEYYDGVNIPYDSALFDLIICTEVLEHCEDSEKLISEMYRVLKKGGTLFITTPFMWGEHEVPYDFRRFTSYGLKKYLKKAGFKIITFSKDYEGFKAILKLVASEIVCDLNNKKYIRFYISYVVIFLAIKFIEKILRIKANRIYLTNQIIVEK